MGRKLGIEYFYKTREEKLANYNNKNIDILANELINPYSNYREINLKEYYQLIFGRNNKYLNSKFSEVELDELELPFEERIGESQIENKYIYNSILIDLKKESKKRSKNWIITKSLKELDNIKGKNFVITAPITYIGRNRNSNNSRNLYAFTIDLDYVGNEELRDFFHQIQNHLIPNPNLITNSGNGLHITYLLDEPYPLYKRSKEILNMQKEILTMAIWNDYTSRLDSRQYQNIFQGYRVPETKTKLGPDVKTFLNLNSGYWSIESLNEFLNKRSFGVNGLDSNLIKELMMIKNKQLKYTSKLEEAREKWPEWFQDRIIDKNPRKYMTFSENLYKWWLRICRGEEGNHKIKVGHRYFCALALVSFATKCGIPKEQVKADLYSLLPNFEKLTFEEENHFVKGDIEDALKIYGTDKAYKFKRDYISKQCNIELIKRKRNGRTREEHIKLVNATKKLKKELGLLEPVKINKKEKTKNQILLKNYLLENQDDKKKKTKDIADALNISERTVKRYYEKTEKEIFLEHHDKSFFLYRYSEELKKEEFFIFKALINNPDLNKNQISQITGISYSTTSKYYPKIKNIIKEWKIYNTSPMSVNRKEKEIG